MFLINLNFDMKKIFYTTLGLFAFVYGANAQTIVVSPDSSYSVVPAAEFEVVGHAEWVNTTTQSVTYNWKRVVLCTTQGWQTLICDENACYPPATSSQEITLGPGDTSRLDVHARPNTVDGKAVIYVEVYDLAYPTDITVAKFFFNTTACTVGTQDATITQARIMPNPVSDVFSIEAQTAEVKNIALYNLQGNLVKTFSANNQGQYNVADVATGVYVVRTTGLDKRVLSASRLVIVR